MTLGAKQAVAQTSVADDPRWARVERKRALLAREASE
jgi:hypothetical protein